MYILESLLKYTNTKFIMIGSNITKTSKRKIGDVEKLCDLESTLKKCGFEKKQKLEKQYTLKITGSTMFLGKFLTPINLTCFAEFIDVKHDSITHIENKEFIRTDNDQKTIKSHINPTFTYLKLHMNLISYEVIMQIFSNGIFLIRNCKSISDAEDTIEKLLFEINQHECPNLFYNKN